ncbi:MAG: hypothetical protein E5V19_03140 [Mesorhizobium sp.]|nr:MAG: hypothetical protein E5V19_03140 [Mesorhizobium sp.]
MHRSKAIAASGYEDPLLNFAERRRRIEGETQVASPAKFHRYFAQHREARLERSIMRSTDPTDLLLTGGHIRIIGECIADNDPVADPPDS